MSTIEKALAKKQSSHKVDIQDSTENTIINDNVTQQSTTNNAITINKDDLIERGFLIDTGKRNQIKEEFRHIKRKILNNAFGKAAKTLNHCNLVMFSSARPNEGKTFVSINMALSIALEQDKSVLLIDADVLKPSVNKELGFENTIGLVDYLLNDELNVSNIIYDTNVDNLKIIPAGTPHHLSNELLASDKMESFAKELASRYSDRIVIFDCPPLLGVTETLILTNFMGQAIVVVEESNTPIADVIRATEDLNEDLALGLVLNKASRSHKDLYGYGYGYGYSEKA